METEPTYLIWTPRLISAPQEPVRVRFNVTPLSAMEWRVAEAEFYQDVLRDVGLRGKALSWEVLPYRCRYHGNPDAADWTDRWKLNWRVSISTDLAIETAPEFPEGYETAAFSPTEPYPDDGLPYCFVLADFPDRGRAERARARVMALPDGPEEPELIEVEGSFYQLQFNLGRRGPEYFQGDAPQAQRIEDTCRDVGGWPTFDERVRVLG